NERQEPLGVFGRVAWVAHLYAVDALTDKRRDALERSGMRWMREDCQTSGAVNERDGVDRGQSLLRDVRGPTVAEVPVECVSKIDCPALRDHGARDVR